MKPTVLIVDDDENILHGLSRTLFRQPYLLLTAKSGDEAQWICKTRSVDVIVSDDQMPGISGGELLAWVAELFPDVVRIMLTGNASASLAIRAINDGRVHNFFTKPCDDVQLAIAIRKGIEMRALTAENRRLTEANRRQSADVRLLAERLQTLGELVDQVTCGAYSRPTKSDAAFGAEYSETTASTDKILGQIQAGVAEAKKIVGAVLNGLPVSNGADLNPPAPYDAALAEVDVESGATA